MTFQPFNLFAVDPSLLMRTHTDPSRMRLGRGSSIDVLEHFMNGGEEAVTAVVWVRIRPQQVFRVTGFASFWSMDPARATREGGDELPAIREVSTAFSGSGGTFANPNYDTHGIAGWEYGCYAVNIETDTPLTLVLAGTEKQVAGSNGVMQAFNIQGSAADWSWSIAGGNGIRFGFGVNPLVQFYGNCSRTTTEGYGGQSVHGEVAHPSITNEWFMCAYRVRFDGAGHAMERQSLFNWSTEWFSNGETTNATARTAFAKDARVRTFIFSTGIEAVRQGVERYGQKIFRQWLTDDQLRNVRDLDMFEMRRRGMSRWRYD